MAWTAGMKATLRREHDGWMVLDTGEINMVGPVFGRVYEVIYVDLQDNLLGLVFGQFPDDAFDANMFRPVRTTNTGMAMLNRLLLPKKARVRA